MINESVTVSGKKLGLGSLGIQTQRMSYEFMTVPAVRSFLIAQDTISFLLFVFTLLIFNMKPWVP